MGRRNQKFNSKKCRYRRKKLWKCSVGIEYYLNPFTELHHYRKSGILLNCVCVIHNDTSCVRFCGELLNLRWRKLNWWCSIVWANTRHSLIQFGGTFDIWKGMLIHEGVTIETFDYGTYKYKPDFFQTTGISMIISCSNERVQVRIKVVWFRHISSFVSNFLANSIFMFSIFMIQFDCHDLHRMKWNEKKRDGCGKS